MSITRAAAFSVAVLSLTLLAGTVLSQPNDAPQPKWTKKFQADVSLVNAGTSFEEGVAREADDVRGAGILQAVDTVHPVMLAIEGDINMTRGERVVGVALFVASFLGIPAVSWTLVGVIPGVLPMAGVYSLASDLGWERRLRRLRLGYPVFAPVFAYFATGSGDRRRIVAASVDTGQKTTIGPYARRRLGNLINETHGVMHVIESREIHSYEYGLDRERHNDVHVAADAAIVGETIERARAYVVDGQMQKALSEAATVLARLEANTRSARPLTAALAERQRSFAEAYELSAELAPSEQRAGFAKRALSEYEQLAESIRQESNAEFRNWYPDLDDRIAKLRRLVH
jgi:hypothetical protein